MKYLKFITLSFITMFIMSCNSIRVTDAHNQFVRPGLPTGITMVKFSWNLTAQQEIKIMSISLHNLDNKKSIPTYSIIDLKNGQLINSTSIKKGDYYISFSIPEDDSYTQSDVSVSFSYIDKNGTQTLQFKPTSKPDLLMR